MLPHSLTNSKTEKYYQNVLKFKSFYWRNNLRKMNNGAYLINLEEYKPKGIKWIALDVNGDNVTYFDSIGVEHIPKEVKNFIDAKNIKMKIYRIQASDSMCGYFFIGFIDFTLKGKSLLDYTNLFSPTEYEKNGKAILKYFH